jgi:hypothetical protein
LTCTSFPSLIPMICRFGLLMKSQRFFIFLSQLFHLFSKYSVFFFSLQSVLSWSPEILPSACSSLLEWLLIVVFIWFKEVSISGVYLFFFWDFLFFVNCLFHILYCLLYFIYLFFIISLVLFQCLLKSSLNSFSFFYILLIF